MDFTNGAPGSSRCYDHLLNFRILVLVQIPLAAILQHKLRTISRKIQKNSKHAPQNKPKPNINTLPQETNNLDKKFTPAKEWEPLSNNELNVIKQLRIWLTPNVFKNVPHDVLVTFVRGFAYRQDWQEASYVFLDRALKWRSQTNADQLALCAPDNCDLFDEICPAGPIGFDTEGHPVLLERLGAVNASRLLKHFSEEEYIVQQCYRREAFRLYSTANSERRNRRLYKCTVVIDLSGLGSSHMSRRMLGLVQSVNALFAWVYPESVHKFYIVNAPWIFRSAWRIVRPWLHPITEAKFNILGRDWRDVFAADGIHLESGNIPTDPPRWKCEMKKLFAHREPADLVRGYLPVEDKFRVQSLVNSESR